MAVATLLNVILRKFNIPTVIGYIIAGAIIGAVMGIEHHGNKELEHIAEFGIVFLMFTIGLEFSANHLLSMKREVFLFGLLQVVVTGAAFAIISTTLFDLSAKSSIIAGLGLALSSTAIVLKILNESGQIKAEFGRNSLGILIFQDIAVIPILLMVTLFTNDDKSIGVLLGETAINALIVLAILIIIGRFFLARIFKVVATTNSKEISMGTILLVVIGASYLAHHFGFSFSLGAFIGGMMLADTIYKYEVEADLIPFRNLLLGVFFVSVGLQIDLNLVGEKILTIIMLLAGIMLVKALVIYLLLAIWQGKKSALKTAITLSQIGEFSLVVFSLLMSTQMLDPTICQTVMITVVCSMICTPFLISNADRIALIFTSESLDDDQISEDDVLGEHVILCGYDSFGRAVSDNLDNAKIKHVVVTDNTDDYIKARKENKMVVFGDASDRVILERLNIGKAMSTVVTADEIDRIKEITASISIIDPKLKVIAKVLNDEEKEELDEFNHEFILDGNSHAASLMVDRINKSRLLANETARLQFLDKFSLDDPGLSLDLLASEQARLLDIMSHSFNALREHRDIMSIKAFHESFKVLYEIIEKMLQKLSVSGTLATKEFERLNVISDNQRIMESMNHTLEAMGKELRGLEEVDATRNLAGVAIEGLDAILMTLKDVAVSPSEEDLQILENLTAGEGSSMSGIRERYLNGEHTLPPSVRGLLVSTTGHMDQLKDQFGALGSNYKRLVKLS
ncbi:cation:proton antiporter [Verrucomicrobiaceae bacterium N1E253]|uniref:Cation:proton antiporter n=1 Tax=Oceaniferula marina TaxID=2748318 RepID=A0A851GRF0_9BACT|nr:cation:proton antiporter [Oceaniferula marina]